MANLTDNLIPPYRGTLELAALPVTASATIYAGSAVEEGADGGVQNGTGAGTTFVGIAMQKGVSNGAIGTGPNIEVAIRGQFLLPVTISGNVARTSVGATVYLTDGATFTTASASAQAIGKIVEVPETSVGLAAGPVWVQIEGVPVRSI